MKIFVNFAIILVPHVPQPPPTASPVKNNTFLSNHPPAFKSARMVFSLMSKSPAFLSAMLVIIHARTVKDLMQIIACPAKKDIF